MNETNVIGLDLAKQVFQVHAESIPDQRLTRKQLSRQRVLPFFAQCPPSLIGMEACASAHYWARELIKLGHQVKLIAPKFVKPFVKSNKNDRNDAEAICEAVQRPTMRFVSVKTAEQQALQHLHGSRQLLVKQRVAISNHLRGVLLEYGYAIPKGRTGDQKIVALLDDSESGLPPLLCSTLSEVLCEYRDLKVRIETLESRLKAWQRDDSDCQLLQTVPGIAVMTSTAIVGHIGDMSQFKNGRQFAAYLGLVPRQSSSGGQERLLGISKRGNAYLRSLLIHGARSVIRHVRRRLAAGQEGQHPWVEQLLERCHPNVVAVALANKMARIAWCLLTRGEVYQAAKVA